jgi:hypothetical protein
MAITYVSGSGAAAGSGSSVTVTAPASIAAGNLLIAIIYMANTGVATYSAPSGWTLAGSIGQFSGTGQGAVYTKTATASEPTSYTFSTLVAYTCAVVLQYAGATGLDGAPLFTRVSTSTTSFASPSQTPAAGDGKVVAFGSFNGNTFTASGPAARASAQAASAESLYAFDALSSPTASYTATCSTSDTGLAISLLLAPAASVVTGATNYTNSGTTCTTTVTGLTGGELLHASVMHRSTLTIPSGWTLLQQGTPLSGESASAGLQQWLSVLYKFNPAGTTSASIAPNQASSGRMNVVLVAVSGADTPIARPTLAATTAEPVSTATHSNNLVSSKDAADLFLWSMDSVFWSTAVSPNGIDWTASPTGMGYYGAGEKDTSAWAPRLGVMTDTVAPGSRTFIPYDTSVSNGGNGSDWMHLLATQIPAALSDGTTPAYNTTQFLSFFL